VIQEVPTVRNPEKIGTVHPGGQVAEIQRYQEFGYWEIKEGGVMRQEVLDSRNRERRNRD
jgi:hypothetical protein